MFLLKYHLPHVLQTMSHRCLAVLIMKQAQNFEFHGQSISTDCDKKLCRNCLYYNEMWDQVD